MKTVIIPAALAALILILPDVAAAASAAAPDPAAALEPTPLDRILAWIVRGGLATIAGLLGPLFLLAAIRRVGWLQEALEPHADELRLAGARVEQRLRDGKPLTSQDATILGGLAIRCGLTTIGLLIFAAALLWRL